MFKRLRDILIFIVLAYIALYFINSEITSAINDQILDLFRAKSENTAIENQVNQLSENELTEAKIYTSLEEAMENPEKVLKLDLSNQKLTDIPAEVFKFKNLQSLDLHNNQISQIPDQVGQLSSLQELNLSENQLNNISSKIDELSFLQKLDLSDNQLTDLPDVLSNLGKLAEIDLSGNAKLNVKKVLNDLGYSRNLKKLTLKIQSPEIQKEIDNLKKLLPDVSVH